ncbi:MAG: TnpV protein, partial [Clostridia bacterium]|nr:TnpV protein [Clostridia bacterium]
MTEARLWRMKCGYGKGDLVSFRYNHATHKGGRSMSFNRQFDSDINPMLLDVSKYNLGRYGRRRLLYLKEHHPDIYTTMIFQGTLGKHLEE